MGLLLYPILTRAQILDPYPAKTLLIHCLQLVVMTTSLENRQFQLSFCY